MDYLKITVKSLIKEEIINYKLYSNRTRSTADRKDILLFDLIKKLPDDENEDVVFKKLYAGKEGKGSYYRLKNRLLTEINCSLVQFYCLEENGGHEIFSEISLSKVFTQKNNFQLASYHLLKAEKKALASENLKLLDIIYSDLISLSIQYGETSPDEFIKKRNANQRKLNDTRILDDALAQVVFKLKRNQTSTKTNSKAEGILNKAITDLSTKKEYQNNLAFKIKLHQSVCKLLQSQQDFETLEKYVQKTYIEFSTKNYFTKNNHEVKLQMLAYLCNTYFLNKKYEFSLLYINKLHKAMSEFKSMLYEKYVFFYYNALINNYTVLDSEKAMIVLNEAKDHKAIKSHPTYLGYIYLNLVVVYFNMKQNKIALKNIIKLYNHKLFSTIDISYQIKIRIAEVILRIETEDLDYALKLLQALYKENKTSFINTDLHYESDFIQLLIALIQKHNFMKNKNSQKLVGQYIDKYILNNSSNIVDYKNWLKEKFNLTA